MTVPTEYRNITFEGLLSGDMYNRISNPTNMLDGNPSTYATYVQIFSGLLWTSYSYLIFRIPPRLKFYGVRVTVGLEKIVRPSGTSTYGDPIPFHFCVAYFTTRPIETSDDGYDWYVSGISKEGGVFSNFGALTEHSQQWIILPLHYCYYTYEGGQERIYYTPRIGSSSGGNIPYISSVPSGVTLSFTHSEFSNLNKPNTNSNYQTDWSSTYSTTEEGIYKGLFPSVGGSESFLLIGIIPTFLFGSQTSPNQLYLRIFDVHLVVPSPGGDWYIYDTTEGTITYEGKFTDGNLEVFVPNLGGNKKVVGFFPLPTQVSKLYMRTKTSSPSGYTVLKLWDDINLNFVNPGEPIATAEVFSNRPTTVEFNINSIISALHIGT